MPDYWGIVGYPVSHSLTPRLFAAVGEHLGMEGAQQVFLEAGGIDEFGSRVAGLEGELWLSCTAPLKHAPQDRLGVKGPDGVNAVNQLKRVDGEWSGTSTDGLGFVAACRHIGVEPSGTVLRMCGGGSAARSIAVAWADAGGLLIPEQGRRTLVNGPWDAAVVADGHADLGIDLDAAPAGGQSATLDADTQVSISYGDGASTDEFAVIMVAAQHLEAWKGIFAPERAAELPSLSELLASL
jgi:hypothetical protein|tara:strand:- start:1780 stop:2499 length:720 start_codon:yes stop_codon:yes gene_type:complete